jgi:hypothetical protein
VVGEVIEFAARYGVPLADLSEVRRAKSPDSPQEEIILTLCDETEPIRKSHEKES